MTQTKVSIKDVHKSFKKDKNTTLTVLNGINFDIKEGEFLSLLGPSGCGKSTLLKLIAGLDHQTSGTITVNGNDIHGPGTDRVVVFQEGGLFPWMTVKENVTYGLKLKKLSQAEIDEKVSHALKMVHLTNFGNHHPHELSGGMKQRVAIARALVMDPDILLMDEPFAALDEQTRTVLHRELQRIWQETGKTIIFITHNIREALILSDRVLLMSTRPGTIKNEYYVDIPRPRHTSNNKIATLESEVMVALEEEMEKVLKEEFGHDYHFEKSSIHRDSNRNLGNHR